MLICEFEGHPPPNPGDILPPSPIEPPVVTPVDPLPPGIITIIGAYLIVTTAETAPCTEACAPKQLKEVSEVGEPPFHKGCRCYVERVEKLPGG